MSTLSSLATSSTAGRAKRVVAAYVSDVHEHAFTRLGPDGKTKVPTGETGFAFRVLPHATDGSVSGVGLWAWLDTPDALRALIASLKGIYEHAVRVEAAMVAAGDWEAAPKAKPAAAPQVKPAAAPAKPASTLSKLAAAKAAALDDGLEDLPF